MISPYLYASELENTQIEDALKAQETKELQVDFRLKSFNSCQDMEDVMEDYFKNYLKNGASYGRVWVGIPMPFIVDEDIAIEESADSMPSMRISHSESFVQEKNAIWGWPGWDSQYSQTNTQVYWVDESDIIKTDGKRSYYYNATQKAVYIIENLKILKKINIPKTMYNADLYIANDTLTIISTWYSQVNYSKRWYYINRNSKTYTMVFDISDAENPKLKKLYMSDGSYSKSRRIGDYVYVLSTNYMNLPWYNFKSQDDINITASKVIPRKIELTYTNDSEKQNLELQWKKFPYELSWWVMANCNEIEYVLPDEDTLKMYNLNPSYNMVSVINIADTNAPVKTKIIAGSNNEIYMSTENLYLSSHMYMNYDFNCPEWWSCFLPFYHRGQNTLLHKLNINDNSLDYDNSTIIPWSPLTQYSMDEYDGYFRIITQNYHPERSSSLYILDSDLQIAGSLTGLWKTEDFKSSRFIWDKLFLVTFQQIDPLFVIDVSDARQPEILWELKMPWYSTYLHPYDENHLIGLWYGTQETEWGWVRNSGVKVDLYEVDYDKKCWDTDLSVEEKKKCDNWDYKWIIVKQKFTQIFWWTWSYSEALNNPRMFVWNNQKKLLFLPVQLYKTDDDVNNYRRTDFFQWVSVVRIDEKNWINEAGRISHIDTTWAEEERTKECLKYSNVPKEPECREIIGGGEYCGEPVTRKYVPSYCYVDSKIGEFIANKSWQYNKSFIKRALYIWDSLLSFSDDQLQIHDIESLEKTWSLFMK